MLGYYRNGIIIIIITKTKCIHISTDENSIMHVLLKVWNCGPWNFSHLSLQLCLKKNIPDIFNCNLK